MEKGAHFLNKEKGCSTNITCHKHSSRMYSENSWKYFHQYCRLIFKYLILEEGKRTSLKNGKECSFLEKENRCSTNITYVINIAATQKSTVQLTNLLDSPASVIQLANKVSNVIRVNCESHRQISLLQYDYVTVLYRRRQTKLLALHRNSHIKWLTLNKGSQSK